MEMKISADISEFKKFAEKFCADDWPRAVIKALVAIAERGQSIGRTQTRSVFDLRSEWIIQGIKIMPATSAQRQACFNALTRHGDCEAAVYVRGGATPEKSLEFMADHEQGEKRIPQKKFIAIPTKALKERSFRTKTGRVKSRYKPSKLLEYYDRANVPYNNLTTTLKGHKQLPRIRRRLGQFFLIRSKKTGRPMIARRVGYGKNARLEFLYILVPSADIKPQWKFVRKVREEFLRQIPKQFVKHIGAIKGV